MQHRCDYIIRIGIASLMLVPAFSLACTCKAWGEISEDKVIDAMCAVDVVFVGKATDLVSTINQARVLKVDPIAVFKGDVSKSVIVRTSTTCDHWYTLNDNYLIFGNIESKSNNLSTSICGPTRFTGKVANAQFQLGIIEENVARIDELCGSAESGARQIRIIRQDRDNIEKSTAENLRLLKDNLRRSAVDYEQLLEEARSIHDDEE